MKDLVLWLERNAAPVGSFFMFGDGKDVDYLIHESQLYQVEKYSGRLEEFGSLDDEFTSYTFNYAGKKYNIICVRDQINFRSFRLTQKIFETAIKESPRFKRLVSSKRPRVRIYQEIRNILEEEFTNETQGEKNEHRT